MANNPLQQYFRQPKIYISLPSKGIYNNQGTFEGDVTNLPVYGMTGMDDIIAKTPDALLSGTSTVNVIESCCSAIKDAWDLSILDTNLIFAAIKIATYGDSMNVSHHCDKCSTENEYNLDLAQVIDHYADCNYDNKIVIDSLVIKTRPLTYKQLTEFNIQNFELQQKLSQVDGLPKDQQQAFINELWKELAATQSLLFLYSVESVETVDSVVSERGFIEEWLENCDKTITDAIKKHFDLNKKKWEMPSFPVKCSNCNAEFKLDIELDQSNFFAQA
jgi:hypothetical protein